jgi:hypothetical protein
MIKEKRVYAEDGYFTRAPPLTDADRAEATVMWDSLVVSDLILQIVKIQ